LAQSFFKKNNFLVMAAEGHLARFLVLKYLLFKAYGLKTPNFLNFYYTKTEKMVGVYD